MNRLLLTVRDNQCPFGCKYCFARFAQYEPPLSLHDVERDPDLLDDISVIYPACDVDIFGIANPLDLLRRTARFNRSICISTKAPLSMKVVQELRKIGEYLGNQGEVLKVGVSFATRRQIQTLEPRTACYATRVGNLRMLQDADVLASVVLKPLLPDVPLKEYTDIIDETREYTRHFVVGDEYVDEATLRTDADGGPAKSVSWRRVNWIRGNPVWPVRTSHGLSHDVVQYIRDCDCEAFVSDLTLMSSLRQQLRSRQRAVQATTCANVLSHS